jgi:hypothetical protein
MSFLAGLRTQQAVTTQGLRLCYLLETGREQVHVRLSLVLAEIEQGHPLPPGVPYIIRSDHLHAPPPYLAAADVLILQQLLDDSSNWQDKPTGSLPEDSADRFIASLLSSGCCYLVSEQGSWHKLTESTSDGELTAASVQPCWAIDEWGSQKIHWQHAAGSVMFFHHRFYLLWEDTGVVAPAQCHLSPAAIAQAISERVPLDYQQVGVFLEDRGRHWQALGLPLPVEPVVVADDVQMLPVLHLTSSPLGAKLGALPIAASIRSVPSG